MPNPWSRQMGPWGGEGEGNQLHVFGAGLGILHVFGGAVGLHGGWKVRAFATLEAENAGKMLDQKSIRSTNPSVPSCL